MTTALTRPWCLLKSCVDPAFLAKTGATSILLLHRPDCYQLKMTISWAHQHLTIPFTVVAGFLILLHLGSQIAKCVRRRRAQRRKKRHEGAELRTHRRAQRREWTREELETLRR